MNWKQIKSSNLQQSAGEPHHSIILHILELFSGGCLWSLETNFVISLIFSASWFYDRCLFLATVAAWLCGWQCQSFSESTTLIQMVISQQILPRIMYRHSASLWRIIHNYFGEGLTLLWCHYEVTTCFYLKCIDNYQNINLSNTFFNGLCGTSVMCWKPVISLC